MEYHTAANLFPLMNDDEFSALCVDIAENGLLEPIWTYEGKILDGRNRFRACGEAGIEPRYKEYEGASPVSFVVSLNLERRHLTASQRACVAVDMLPMLEVEAKERQGSRADIKELIPGSSRGQARDKAAEATSVNPRYVSDAKRIKVEKPEVFEDIRSGNTTIAEVVKQEKVEARKEKIADLRANLPESTPQGEFNVIVIDPPWRYDGDETYDPDGFRGGVDYPTMSVDEIAQIEMPAADDCVLWLWTTHRFMRHSFTLLDNWGFEEKAILTWVKNRMGIGRWLRSQTEFCIMAAKGKPTIDLTNQTTVLHADMREHSRKPDEFYKMVDGLCVGRKLDYFSREKREDWHQYGNDESKF